MHFAESTFTANLQFLGKQGVDSKILSKTEDFVLKGRRFLPLASSILMAQAVIGVVTIVAAAALRCWVFIAFGSFVSFSAGLVIYEGRKLIVKLHESSQTSEELIAEVANRLRKLDHDLQAQTSIAQQTLRLTEQIVELKKKLGMIH